MLSTSRGTCSPKLFREVCLLLRVLQGAKSTLFPWSYPLPEWRVHRGRAEVYGRMFAVSSTLSLKKTEGGQM